VEAVLAFRLPRVEQGRRASPYIPTVLFPPSPLARRRSGKTAERLGPEPFPLIVAIFRLLISDLCGRACSRRMRLVANFQSRISWTCRSSRGRKDLRGEESGIRRRTSKRCSFTSSTERQRRSSLDERRPADRGKDATLKWILSIWKTLRRDVKTTTVRARTAEIAARNRAFRSRYQCSRAYFRG
jgi:hypothetical protein